MAAWYIDYAWYMSMKRTNVYADPEDLAIITGTFEGTGRTPSKSEVRDTVADAVRRESDPDSGTAA